MPVLKPITQPVEHLVDIEFVLSWLDQANHYEPLLVPVTCASIGTCPYHDTHRDGPWTVDDNLRQTQVPDDASFAATS